MTEKRYELTFMDCYYITDHQTKDYASVLEEDLEEVVNRLNEQNETIQQKDQLLKEVFEEYCDEYRLLDNLEVVSVLNKIAIEIGLITEKEWI